MNPEQQRAVEAVEGRVLILAGAGSGKTRVLTYRMAHLIHQLKVSPKAILGLTFTNKAAAEMRHRLAALVEGKLAKQVTLCTFHSFCMQVLRNEIHHLGYTTEFTLYDEKDVQRLVSMIARDLLEHDSVEMPSLEATMAAIARAKSRGLKPEQLAAESTAWHDEFARTVYRRLQHSMRAYNAVDFDNLLWLTVELFENHRDVLEHYQERFRFIMIDEYQDTNPIQYRLAALLAEKYQNLCVVGDDDQSIYGWRGADVRNILDFSSATVVKLEQNYRSTNVILKAANAMISNNTTRHIKALWSERGDGDPIEIFYAPNEGDEAQAVVARMNKLREQQGLRWKDMAILYRSNALSRHLEMALLKFTWKDGDNWVRGIPYQIHGGVEFYERREVKDLMAYLRVIVNPRDEEALLRVINTPRRGIGEATLDAITSHNRTRDIPLWAVLKAVNEAPDSIEGVHGHLTPQALKGIQNFTDTIELAKAKFASGVLHETMLWLLERVDYQRAIKEEVKSDQMRKFKLENVEEFVNSMADYERMHVAMDDKKPSLHDFVLSTPLKSSWEKNQQVNDSVDRVTLMTFHSSKGLEFPACFLVGVEDHIIPHEKSLKETGIEEERRLMYVAITRAMRFLTISMAVKRARMGQECVSKPSRFVKEIPADLLKATPWHEV